jgi:hypothetical protein
MDMAVDEARKHRLAAKVDRGRAGGRCGMALLNGDDSAIVDDDRRGAERRLARDRDEAAGVDIGWRCECR